MRRQQRNGEPNRGPGVVGRCLHRGTGVLQLQAVSRRAWAAAAAAACANVAAARQQGYRRGGRGAGLFAPVLRLGWPPPRCCAAAARPRHAMTIVPQQPLFPSASSFS